LKALLDDSYMDSSNIPLLRFIEKPELCAHLRDISITNQGVYMPQKLFIIYVHIPALLMANKNTLGVKKWCGQEKQQQLKEVI